MAKGKRGPRPEIKSTAIETAQPVMRHACSSIGCDFVGTIEEWEDHRDANDHAEFYMKEFGPTAEEIVGKENVVDVDAQEVTERQPLERQGYKCIEVGCAFQTGYLSEMEEHAAGTGHGGYKTETLDPLSATQPELFSEPGIVHRMIDVPMDAAFLSEKREKLANLYQRILDVKSQKASADSRFNEEIKGIDTQMQEIARVLKTPYTYEKAECEWKIIDGENARGLYRLDTGELLDKAPLSAEDMVAEQERAAKANAETLEVPA